MTRTVTVLASVITRPPTARGSVNPSGWARIVRSTTVPQVGLVNCVMERATVRVCVTRGRVRVPGVHVRMDGLDSTAKKKVTIC